MKSSSVKTEVTRLFQQKKHTLDLLHLHDIRLKWPLNIFWRSLPANMRVQNKSFNYTINSFLLPKHFETRTNRKYRTRDDWHWIQKQAGIVWFLLHFIRQTFYENNVNYFVIWPNECGMKTTCGYWSDDCAIGSQYRCKFGLSAIPTESDKKKQIPWEGKIVLTHLWPNSR